MTKDLNTFYKGAYTIEDTQLCKTLGAHIVLEGDGFRIVKDSEPTTEELYEELATKVRAERDRRIAETDWYMMPDYPADPETLEVVKSYRKALRDITLQSGFPRDVEWPVMPKVFCEDTEGTPSIGLAKVGIP